MEVSEEIFFNKENNKKQQQEKQQQQQHLEKLVAKSETQYFYGKP